MPDTQRCLQVVLVLDDLRVGGVGSPLALRLPDPGLLSLVPFSAAGSGVGASGSADTQVLSIRGLDADSSQGNSTS